MNYYTDTGRTHPGLDKPRAAHLVMTPSMLASVRAASRAALGPARTWSAGGLLGGKRSVQLRRAVGRLGSEVWSGPRHATVLEVRGVAVELSDSTEIHTTAGAGVTQVCTASLCALGRHRGHANRLRAVSMTERAVAAAMALPSAAELELLDQALQTAATSPLQRPPVRSLWAWFCAAWS